MTDTIVGQLITARCCATECDAEMFPGDSGWGAVLGRDGQVRLTCPACTVLVDPDSSPRASDRGRMVALHPDEAGLIAVIRNTQRRRIRHLSFKRQRARAGRDSELMARQIDASGKELNGATSRCNRLMVHILANPPAGTLEGTL